MRNSENGILKTRWLIMVSIVAVCAIGFFVSPINAKAAVLESGTFNVSTLNSNEKYEVHQVNDVVIILDTDKILDSIELQVDASLTIKSTGAHKLTMKNGIHSQSPNLNYDRNIIKIEEGVSLDTGYLCAHKIDIDTHGTVNITGQNVPSDGGITRALHGFAYLKIKNATLTVVAENARSSSMSSKDLIEINNASITAQGGVTGISSANNITITGVNTVIKASGSDEAILYGVNMLALDNALKAVVPSGAIIGTQTIKESDGTTSAKTVEIKAAAIDGSAPGAPSAKGTELKDEAGNARGYEVTSSDPANPAVAYKGTKSDKNKATITIPDTIKDLSGNEYKVTEIKARACEGYSKVTTIKVGNNVEKIGTKAFSKCKKLSKATLGKNVTTIGSKAFDGDNKLTKITIKSKKLKKVSKKAFKDVSNNAVYKVPKGKAEKYTKLLKKGGMKTGSKVKE